MIKAFLQKCIDVAYTTKSAVQTISMQELADMMRSGSGSRAGQAVTKETSLRLAAVFACVRVLSFSASYLPWRLFKQSPDGSKELAINHPLHRVLNLRPNNFQTPANFKVFKTICELNDGNFYAFKVKDNAGNIRELLPLDPNQVTIKRHGNWEIEYTVTAPNGTKKKYSRDDIYHSFLYTINGFSGVGVLRYARECIGKGLAMQDYGSALFANGARPDYVIEVPRTVQGEALTNLKNDWDKLYKGTSNGGRPAFLEDGMKINTLTLKNDDVQFLETQAFTRTEICGFYGVPPSYIGDVSSSNFKNMESQKEALWTVGLMPWVNNDEESTRLQLLKPHEQLKFVVDIDESLMRRGDMKAQTEYMKAAVGRPTETVNEWRTRTGKNRIEGQDADKLALQAGTGDGNSKNKGEDDESDDDEK